MSSKSDGNAPKELTSREIKIINTFRSVSSSVKKLYKSIIFRRVFIAVSLIFILGIGIPTSYSLYAKHIGNELYKNAEYSESLEQYLKAKEWWVLEKIALRFHDRDLYNKIDKANVMIKSEEYYKSGLQAFSDGNFQEAINYFSSMAERDPNIDDAYAKIEESERKIEEEETRIREEREKKRQEELAKEESFNDNYFTLEIINPKVTEKEPEVFAGVDESKPRFNRIEFSSNTVKRTKTIKVFVYANDYESGLSHGDTRAVDSEGNTDIRADAHCDKVSDDKLECILEIPPYGKVGTWHIAYVNIRDIAGHETHKSFDDDKYTFKVE